MGFGIWDLGFGIWVKFEIWDLKSAIDLGFGLKFQICKFQI